MFEWIIDGGRMPEIGGEFIHVADISRSDLLFGGSIATSRDGDVVVVGGRNAAFIYSSLIFTQQIKGIWVTMSEDGATIATADHNINTVWVYTRQMNGSYTLSQTIVGPDRSRFGNHLTLSPDGTVLLIGESLTGALKFYSKDSSTYVLKQTMAGDGPVPSSNIDGSIIVSSDLSGTSSRVYKRNAAGLYEQSQQLDDGRGKITGDGNYIVGKGFILSATSDGTYIPSAFTVSFNNIPLTSYDSSVLVDLYIGDRVEVHSNMAFEDPQVILAPDLPSYGQGIHLSPDGNLLLVGARFEKVVKVYRRG